MWLVWPIPSSPSSSSSSSSSSSTTTTNLGNWYHTCFRALYLSNIFWSHWGSHQKGRKWRKAAHGRGQIIIFSCIFVAFWSLGRDSESRSRTLEKFYPGISMEISAACFCLPKKSHMKKGLLPNFAQRDFSPFLIPPSKDSCFWCGFTDSTPMKMHHTKITIKIC